MSYEPTIWRTGDTVTAEKLNKIEQAIVADNTAIEGKVGRDEFDTEIATLESKVGSPLIASTVSEMTETDRVYVYTGSETGYTSGNWYYYDGTAWTSGGVYNAVAIETDTTLSVSGKAADAKKAGDEINSLKEDLNNKSNRIENEAIQIAGVVEEMECGLTDEVKTALLNCFAKVAWIDAQGQTYYDALEDALNNERTLSSISAVFNQGSAVIYDTDELYALKQYLTVTATYSDGTTREVSNYTLDGALTIGTSTITVAYNKKTTTFNVTVTHQTKTLESISATFDSSASITTDNVLDDLRPYLTVLATYADSTTSTISNYNLSGNLNVGTNTITVSYGGKTTTFTVNVTQAEATLQSISATFNQGSVVIYENSSLESLKPYLTVTANYSDSTTQTVTNYTLSGTLATGISTITVSYSGKTTTFNVTVSERPTIQSITATFTQGSAIIYENSSLNDLKQYLVVTATYSDSTIQTVTDYTLSGVLTAGTSTITASYGGKTDTFNVTVSARATEPIYKLTNTAEFNGTSDYIDTGLQLLTANKTNLTIVFDILDKIPVSNANGVILHCMHEAKPYPGMTIYGRLIANARSYGFELNSNNGSDAKIYEENLTSESPVRTKAVWVINFTSKTSHVYFSINDTSDYKKNTITDAMLNVNITENALIGCYQKTDGTKGRYWTGTMYDFKIYDYAWTENAAQAYLQEDHS